MSSPVNQRASERVATNSRVKVMSKGRMIAYSLALNISMGGVLLDAAAALPIGSRCELAIFPSANEGKARILAEGTVVRSDDGGTAIQFLRALEKDRYQTLVGQAQMNNGNSLLNAYRSYFKVGQSQDLKDCEKLLGVSKRTFRTVFYTSFCACIPLAVLPVWLMRANIPEAPIWVKVASSFAYGTIWLMVVQPTIDLAAFRILRMRKPSGSGA